MLEQDKVETREPASKEENERKIAAGKMKRKPHDCVNFLLLMTLGASSILSWESLDRELASPLVSSFYRLELELFIFMHRSSRNKTSVVYELMSLAGKNKKEMPETTTSSRFHG